MLCHNDKEIVSTSTISSILTSDTPVLTLLYTSIRLARWSQAYQFQVIGISQSVLKTTGATRW